jgi:hypothetical protein
MGVGSCGNKKGIGGVIEGIVLGVCEVEGRVEGGLEEKRCQLH